MKILWLGNIVLPDISRKEKIPLTYSGGWMVDLAKEIENKGTMEQHKLVYVFDNAVQIHGEIRYCSYYGIPCSENNTKKSGKSYIDCICEILKDELPDVIHIWGTEYPHCCGMVEACKKTGLIDRVVVSIQGMPSVYAKHYMAYLPEKICSGYKLKNIKYGSLRDEQKKFKLRGRMEIESLRSVKHVIGRTEWDRACVWQINSNVKYHLNYETLRSEFYDGSWKYDRCTKHRIFMSQAYYPIKGFHLMLEGLKVVIDKYPDTTLYLAGTGFSNISKFKMTKYEKYCMDIIKKAGMECNVHFLGGLNAKEMKENYLRSNVFVCPSSIENSPNSVGEAMLLGVPVVASYVGGVHDMLEHKKEGYLYPADETYMLSYYICKIFEDQKNAEKMSEKARMHARITHDPENNIKQLMKIYKEINGR